jgi:hypothetical protein
VGCQYSRPSRANDVAEVLRAANFDVRSQKRVQPEFGEKGAFGLEPHANEYAGMIRVCYQFFHETKSASSIFKRNFKAECLSIEVFVSRFHFAFADDKRLPIADEELKIPDLRSIDRGIINFVEHAFGNGEPNIAEGRIGRPNTVFIASRPTGGYSRSAPGGMVVPCNCHWKSFWGSD